MVPLDLQGSDSNSQQSSWFVGFLVYCLCVRGHMMLPLDLQGSGSTTNPPQNSWCVGFLVCLQG